MSFSGRDVNTIEGYVLVNFGVSGCNNFGDIKKIYIYIYIYTYKSIPDGGGGGGGHRR